MTWPDECRTSVTVIDSTVALPQERLESSGMRTGDSTHAADGVWPSQARAVLCEIYGTRPADDTSIGIQLLADVHLI